MIYVPCAIPALLLPELGNNSAGMAHCTYIMFPRLHRPHWPQCLLTAASAGGGDIAPPPLQRSQGV